MHNLIFGCGYVGHRVALLWRERGHRVTVATRSNARGDELRADGFDVLVCDVTDRQSLVNMPAADVVLFAVGYDRAAPSPIHDVYAGGLANVLDVLPGSEWRVIYISSTGVYGDAGGGWVDEDVTPDPQRAGGAASLAAERVLLDSRFADRATILRLAGIYGPGRVPYIDRLRAGEPIEAVQDGWLNLIHVDDAVAAVDAAAEGKVSGLVNVSDGHPVLRRDYYHEVARQIGVAAPRFVDPPPSSPKAARAGVDRRISNRRMGRELAVNLRYPTYVEGLAAIVEPTR